MRSEPDQFRCLSCGELVSGGASSDASEGAGRCPRCGGTLELDERRGSDRRGPNQRVWDPEPRRGGDRRTTDLQV